jgi:hypothetical protein
VLVVLSNEGRDRIRQFALTFEAPPIQRFSLQQAKYDLDLV